MVRPFTGTVPAVPGPRSRRGLIAPLWSLLLTIVVLGPALRPGQLLLRDMVSSPRSYLTDSALGLAGTAPRAVPQDVVVAVLSRFVDGADVVRAVLVLALVAGGVGAALLVRHVLGRVAVGPEVVGATVAVWNPLVAERLLQGQWSLLLGVGVLPWVVLAGLALRAGRRAHGRALLVLAVVLAGLTPTGAVLATLTAVTVLAWPGSGRRGPDLTGAVLLGAVTAAPWLVAAFLGGAGVVTGDEGVRAFAARAEPGLGTLGSLLGLGGIWNSEAVPTSRTTGFAVVGTVLLVAVSVPGLPRLWRQRWAVPAGPLLLLAALGVLGPALAATGPGITVLEGLVRVVPGAGLLRDTQKWVALSWPLHALAAGVAVAHLRLRRRWWVAPAAVVAVLLALPDLAWGAFGAVRPVHYPTDWAAVAAVLADPATGPGDVAVLPGGTFRRFAFSGPAAVLDPAGRWLDRDVLSPGDLTVGGTTVRGEDARARRVQTQLLQGGDPAVLARAGVGWVLVERGTPGPTGRAQVLLDQLRPVRLGSDLALYQVPGAVTPVRAPGGARASVLVAHVVPALLLLGAVTVLAGGALRRRWSH